MAAFHFGRRASVRSGPIGNSVETVRDDSLSQRSRPLGMRTRDRPVVGGTAGLFSDDAFDVRGQRMTDSATRRRPTRADRRSQERQTMISRVGLLEQDEKVSFCLVRNVSSTGIQIKLYTPSAHPGEVVVRVADEDPMHGRIVWISDGNAGIRFEAEIDPVTLLRLQQKLSQERRRSMPRVRTTSHAAMRVNGRKVRAELADISSMGARVTTSRSLEVGTLAFITLPELPEIRAYVRWTDGQESGLVFEPPIPMKVIGQWLDDRLPATA